MAVMLLRERAEKVVDGRAIAAASLQLRQAEVSVDRAQVGIRRNDIDAVRLEGNRFRDLWTGICTRLQKFGEMALVFGREMHDDHEGQAAVVRARS